MKAFGDGRLQRGGGEEVRDQVCTSGDTRDPQNKYKNQTSWFRVKQELAVTNGEAKEQTFVFLQHMNERVGWPSIAVVVCETRWLTLWV